MNTTETWSITVQPWQVRSAIRVTVRRATYTNQGRQKWELVREWDCEPAQLTDTLLQAQIVLKQLKHDWEAAKTEQLELPAGAAEH